MVIGVGNPYRHDDGAGTAVAAALRDRPTDGVAVVDSDGEPAGLINAWQAAREAIVIDAARHARSAPGTIHRIDLARDRLYQEGNASSHGIGLGEAIELARVLRRLPRHLVLYSIEPADTSLGVGLDPAVRRAVSVLANRIRSHLERA
ncbi:hypothetical protein Athai_08870 [Actinocatenispora thailandica]|uniref:Hydrogenase maturation protease n=1 Tax=Actinocatenispora thailandica TaxID=227318 RepID=A0A7R7DKI3_9ACTN|nr:hypothetical protein Athai_08870 [Actinocatenispora thailandica]